MQLLIMKISYKKPNVSMIGYLHFILHFTVQLLRTDACETVSVILVSHLSYIVLWYLSLWDEFSALSWHCILDTCPLTLSVNHKGRRDLHMQSRKQGLGCRHGRRVATFLYVCVQVAGGQVDRSAPAGCVYTAWLALFTSAKVTTAPLWLVR